MKRRTFLKLATLGVGAATPGLLTPAPPVASQVNTVLGPIPATRLGRTLMHEHVLVDFVGADRIVPGRYDADEVVRTVLSYLRELKADGCGTLVECTPAYLGRDPRLLRRLSESSGLHIITNTGLYGAAADKYVPHYAFMETAEQLSARWVREFHDGIPPTGIRPGFIKIGVDPGPLSEIDGKLVDAAALTHLRVGLNIASHTGDGTAALAQIERLQRHGVHPSAFIWVHAQTEKETHIHQQAAEAGAWLEFDGISPDTVQQHIDLIKRMKELRRLRQVLISQDAGWYHVGESGGGSFRAYAYLFARFLPALRKAGFADEDIQTLLVFNPQRALTPVV
jgi:phosphotriesterase-related protein